MQKNLQSFKSKYYIEYDVNSKYNFDSSYGSLVLSRISLKFSLKNVLKALDSNGLSNSQKGLEIRSFLLNYFLFGFRPYITAKKSLHSVKKVLKEIPPSYTLTISFCRWVTIYNFLVSLLIESGVRLNSLTQIDNVLLSDKMFIYNFNLIAQEFIPLQTVIKATQFPVDSKEFILGLQVFLSNKKFSYLPKTVICMFPFFWCFK